MIIEKNKSVVNEQMSEGFTALHIAAANDHVEIASALIRKVNHFTSNVLLKQLSGFKGNIYCAYLESNFWLKFCKNLQEKCHLFPVCLMQLKKKKNLSYLLLLVDILKVS